ncbi:hypothetical protein A5630_20785 [Mycolicibacterium mucogenicum]|uniref:Uncharacterized protein n=1 Tax=Mycolicibacterium mucogenicum TaxID=56689 RepID=A0A1A3H4J6_MYCMU|nr:hypothetical protein A5630_20785 [Mycolicibacterium mucogenicum]
MNNITARDPEPRRTRHHLQLELLSQCEEILMARTRRCCAEIDYVALISQSPYTATRYWLALKDDDAPTLPLQSVCRTQTTEACTHHDR